MTIALEHGRLEQSLEQLRSARRELSHQALHDHLTGLANRALFERELSEAIEAGSDEVLAVMFIDIDDFKTVNDSLGHAAGDALLGTIADRITSSIPAVIARPASVGTSSQ